MAANLKMTVRIFFFNFNCIEADSCIRLTAVKW